MKAEEIDIEEIDDRLEMMKDTLEEIGPSDATNQVHLLSFANNKETTKHLIVKFKRQLFHDKNVFSQLVKKEQALDKMTHELMDHLSEENLVYFEDRCEEARALFQKGKKDLESSRRSSRLNNSSSATASVVVKDGDTSQNSSGLPSVPSKS